MNRDLSETARWHIERAREAMAEKRASYCLCGVPRERCTHHSKADAEPTAEVVEAKAARPVVEPTPPTRDPRAEAARDALHQPEEATA